MKAVDDFLPSAEAWRLSPAFSLCVSACEEALLIFFAPLSCMLPHFLRSCQILCISAFLLSVVMYKSEGGRALLPQPPARIWKPHSYENA